jgi:hypothetical protein
MISIHDPRTIWLLYIVLIKQSMDVTVSHSTYAGNLRSSERQLNSDSLEVNLVNRDRQCNSE